MNISTHFISSGCACRENVLDWCPLTNQIIFAIKWDIGVITPIEDESDFRIVETAPAHSADVSCVKFVKSEIRESTSNLFLTGSSNGEVGLWRICSNASPRLSLLHKLPKSDDEFAITHVGGYFTNFNENMLDGYALFSHNDTISIVLFNFTESKTLVPIKFHDLIVLSFDLLVFEQFYILAVGLTNGSVELLFANKSDIQFSRGLKLAQQQNGWARSLAFTNTICADSGSLFMLASTSDEFIRIWNFSRNDIGKVRSDTSEDSELQVRKILLKMIGNDKLETILEVKLDSVLNGHDGRIHSLQWHPEKRFLLSASVDKNVILWKTMNNVLWVPQIRMGEVGGEAVGFYDAIFSPNGTQILFHSFFGAFYRWEINHEREQAFPKKFSVNGHFDGVADFDWEPQGNYLISCGLDKTTRIFAPLKHKNQFVEIARPQMHGHSLSCIRSISSVRFVSGAEEKIFRVFQAPITFIDNLKTLTDVVISDKSNLEFAASMPMLGLSNKAISSLKELSNEREEHDGFSVDLENQLGGGFKFTEPPLDDQLTKYTLFPEIHKLYGHGFEVFTLTSNPMQTLIATVCKASHEEDATILIWDTIEWCLRSTIKMHQLTVTQLAFSPNNRFLLSVSRDRTWNLFTNADTDNPYQFTVYAQGGKQSSGHSRIIWSCAWSHDSKYFVTSSRDKILNIWRVDDNDCVGKNVTKCGTFVASDSITAVDFAPKLGGKDGSYILALGKDNGEVVVLEWRAALGDKTAPSSSTNFVVLKELDQCSAFSATINRLRFRPNSSATTNCDSDKNAFEFCCCSVNHVMKLFKFYY